jgi:hypothetical protein
MFEEVVASSLAELQAEVRDEVISSASVSLRGNSAYGMYFL